MTFAHLTWAFALATAVHNLEEAIWLPGWSQSAGRWHVPVGAREFRFAVTVLTALAAFAALLATVQGKQSLGAYIVSGYALAMLFNVAIPHVLATLALRQYMPGTTTALLLNLPATSLLLSAAFAEGFIDCDRFLIAGPAVVVGIVALIPALFWIGRRSWQYARR
jgi:hypothetical protein